MPCWCGAGTVMRGPSTSRSSRLDGTASLFGPAPAGLEGAREDRQFESSFKREIMPEAEVDAHLARQIEFDADIWIVAVDDRQGRHFLEDWLARP